jgi:phenylacetate-CoA ligase
LEVDKEKYSSVYDNMLKNEFYHKFGKKTQVFIYHVNEIKREKSGKFRFIINNVKDN